MLAVLFAGFLGTALLSRATSSASAAGNLSGAFSVLNSGIRKLVDPSIPAIADHSKASSTSSSSSSNSSASGAVPVKSAPGPGATTTSLITRIDQSSAPQFVEGLQPPTHVTQ